MAKYDWVKKEEVGLEQEKAGHRNASSTERSEQTNLEELQGLLGKHYPLG